METVLHSLISQVKKSTHVKEYTLPIFMDTKGAFNIADSDASWGSWHSEHLTDYCQVH